MNENCFHIYTKLEPTVVLPIRNPLSLFRCINCSETLQIQENCMNKFTAYTLKTESQICNEINNLEIDLEKIQKINQRE